MNIIEIRIRQFIAKLKNVEKKKEQEELIGKIRAKRILSIKEELVDRLIELDRVEIGNKNDLIIVVEKIKLIDEIISCRQQEDQE